MIKLSEELYKLLYDSLKNIKDTIEYRKNTYEDRCRSFVEIYRQKNITGYLKAILYGIRNGEIKDYITIPHDDKFSMDSYIIYLTLLSKLLEKEGKFELVICDKTHIRANNYGVKFIIHHAIKDILRGIKLGANYDNVRLERVRGEKYDHLYYKHEGEKIILVDEMYLYSDLLTLDKFNYMISNIKIPGYQLPFAYMDGLVVMMPLIGIKCKC